MKITVCLHYALHIPVQSLREPRKEFFDSLEAGARRYVELEREIVKNRHTGVNGCAVYRTPTISSADNDQLWADFCAEVDKQWGAQ